MDEKQGHKKKYEALRDELIDFIIKNNLKQDDQLPTVREIIKNIGYSYATVHRTLIEMEKEGIITKRQGKGLFVNIMQSKSSNKQVALIIPKDFSDHKIFIDLLAGVRVALEKANINLMVSISNMSHEKEKETIRRLIANRINGMIIFLEDNYVYDYTHIVDLKKRKFPFVLVDRYIPELETDFVVVNNKDAMLKICSYLKYNRHCDKIVFVPTNDAPSLISSSNEKLDGFKNAVQVLYTEDKGTIVLMDEIVAKIGELSVKYKNVGICVNHDALIIEIQRMMKEKKIEIPLNCHFFGYNNSYETPVFPTVEQFNEQIGMKAAEILIEKMKASDYPVQQIRTEAKLVLPNSAGGFYLED